MPSDSTGWQPDGARARQWLAKLRAICARLPEAQEIVTWGHPTFRTGDKIFASFGEYHGEWCIGFKTSRDEQALLCHDDRYFVSPYVGKHGWTSMRLTGRVPWGEVERLVEGSFRRIARKGLVHRLDEG